MSPYCTCYPTEQTVAGLLVPLADRGPPVWACEICILARGALSPLRQDKAPLTAASVRAELVRMISTREEIDGKREVPREPGEGRQKEGRSGFLRATPNRFPGKTYLHTQDSATSYLSEPRHVLTEQMGNFFRAFLQKFQPIKLRSWALFTAPCAHADPSG